MNKDALKKSLGHRVRLRPLVLQHEGTNQLPAIDDDWSINRIGDDFVELSNLRTNHVALLGFDHIYGFTSEPARNRNGIKFGFLTLNVQLTLAGEELRIEPIPPRDRGKVSTMSASDVHLARTENTSEKAAVSPSSIAKALQRAKAADEKASAASRRLTALETKGTQALTKEYQSLLSILDEELSPLVAQLAALKLEYEISGTECVLRTDRVSLNFYLHTGMPIVQSRVALREFDGAIILPKNRSTRMFLPGEHPRQVAKKEFYFDYEEPVGWGWRQKETKTSLLTTLQLAATIIELLMELQNQYQGKEREFGSQQDDWE